MTLEEDLKDSKEICITCLYAFSCGESKVQYKFQKQDCVTEFYTKIKDKYWSFDLQRKIDKRYFKDEIERYYK